MRHRSRSVMRSRQHHRFPTGETSEVNCLMRTVLIFRERLLAPSETFIIEQAKALRGYLPVLVGLRRTQRTLNHPLPEILLRDGHGPLDKLAANLYRKFPARRAFLRQLGATHPSIVHAHFAVDAMQALPVA